MKLNNKGFAISGILYPIFILFLVLILGILGVLGATKVNLDRINKEIELELNGTTILPNFVVTGRNIKWSRGVEIDLLDGVLAYDNLGNKLAPERISYISSPSFDYNVNGSYTILYEVLDSKGRLGFFVRTIEIIDPIEFQMEVLVIAGGGGGQGTAYGGGGGGAGGVIHGFVVASAGQEYFANIGSGGPGSTSGVGGKGGDSTFGLFNSISGQTTIFTAFGGGPSNASQDASLRSGGSGGGASHMNPAGLVSPSTQTNNGGGTGYGNQGGASNYSSPYNHGSGGGASAPGTTGGPGGAGITLTIFNPTRYSPGTTSVTYAGGGGQTNNSGATTLGGIGGGGSGANNANGGNGQPATGSGGGGARLGTGGSGGSGIAIVKYLAVNSPFYEPCYGKGGSLSGMQVDAVNGNYCYHDFNLETGLSNMKIAAGINDDDGTYLFLGEWN